MDQSAKNPFAPQCTCMTDAFADLPLEVKPQRTPRKSSLRKVICPGCGLSYWTNRPTDLCMDCEKKGRTGGQIERRD